MKKLMYLPFLLLLACGDSEQKPSEVDHKAPAPLARSQNSDAFNSSFEQMLNDYYALKDALVRSKDKAIAPGVDSAANALVASSNNLNITELKADEAIVSTAKSYSDGISAEAKALAGEKELENKRKTFQMISDQMYDLVRTVRYDKQVVYHQYCPMAFNDQGAYWLSDKAEIRNPYFGSKMLKCGEVKDSLDFRAKQ